MSEYLSKSLTELHKKAKEDEELRKKLLDTQNAKDPVFSFCETATKEGFPITVGEIMQMDDVLLSDLLKSVNGGATYPFEDWGDTYENFINSL